MKKILAVILFVLFSIPTFAQCDTDSTESFYIPDHPGYTYNAHLVGNQRMDVEVGIGYGNPYNLDRFNKKTGMIYNTTYFRYGAFKHLELRFGFEFGDIPSSNTKGFSAFNVGIKVPIITDVKNVPDIAIVATTYVPSTGKDEVGGNFTYYAPNVTLVLQKGFFDKLFILGNGGVYWDGFDTRIKYNASIAAYFYVLPKWGLFAETAVKCSTYGSPTNLWDFPTNLWDFGTTVYITDNLEWDLSAGTNYVTGLDNAFINTGICWRLPNKWSHSHYNMK